jgi:WD40 repeat protein
LAAGSEDTTVNIWDISSGNLIRKFTGHSSTVKTVSYSPDGIHILTGSADGKMIIFNAETGATVRITLLLNNDEWITYSDKKMLYVSSAEGDNYAAIRFGNTLTPVYPLKDYRNQLKRDNITTALEEPQPVIQPPPSKFR